MRHKTIASMGDRTERQRKRGRQPPKWRGRKTKMKENRVKEINREIGRNGDSEVGKTMS